MFEKQPKIITLDTIGEFCNKDEKRKKSKPSIDKKIHNKNKECKSNIEVNNSNISIEKEKEIPIKVDGNKIINDNSEEIILWL